MGALLARKAALVLGAAHFHDRTTTTGTFVIKVLKDINKT